MRLDRWLWAARFFKTRGLAVEAINGGKVQLNERRSKPSRAVGSGDSIRIRKGPYQYDIVVIALAERRGSAVLAATLYQETEASIEQRQELALQRRQQAADGPGPRRRPSKKDRRHIIRFTRRDQ